MEQRLKVEARINQLEGGNRYRVSGTGKEAAKFNKYESKGEVLQYKTAADNTMAAPQKRKLIEEIRYRVLPDLITFIAFYYSTAMLNRHNIYHVSYFKSSNGVNEEDSTEEPKKKKKKKKEKDNEGQLEDKVDGSGDAEKTKKKKKKDKTADGDNQASEV